VAELDGGVSGKEANILSMQFVLWQRYLDVDR